MGKHKANVTYTAGWGWGWGIGREGGRRQDCYAVESIRITGPKWCGNSSTPCGGCVSA